MTLPHERVAETLAAVAGPEAVAAELLCDRHPPDAVAVRVVEPDLTSTDLTYGELHDRSARLATALAGLGVGVGDRVATLMPKSADLVVAALAIWRLGAVQVPLFTAFARPAIALRITGNGTKAVICDPSQRPKLAPGDGIPDAPEWRVISTGAATGTDLALHDLLTAEPWPHPVAVGGEGTLVELFTSGTTGAPKAVPLPLRAVAAILMYQEYGLDHRPDDVFWNAADPGWAYGLYYGLIGPLALGRTTLLLHSAFSPELTWSVLARFGVTNFTAGPTVFRALRAQTPARAEPLALRHCSSAGEPLGADVVAWAERTLGVPVRDHYGQTELGMAVANAWHPEVAAPLRPGSMGRALPGWRLDVLRPDADEPAPRGTPGRLAVDVESSPLMWFTGYRDAPERTAERFTADGRWYLTGDAAAQDDDGYLTFASRDDDVILMAGYRIGPYEVESLLERHEAVAEAAVVGAPDDLRGEIVVAHVVLRQGAEPGDALVDELQKHVKTHLAAHSYPREIRFVNRLPRTPSGKLQRYLLRESDGSRQS
ncbi:AMP-dependent synthetase [Streptomyces spiralis]|uniref:AMP-dependent synthetase n=1 Tax=Streptomyces spiralis TaxID=66376 RepID=A0A918ZN24_9ACTN|nr:AMP-binding protein [Streptomyces spiralis]GHE59757.1 AMP-dependent synthetase [Streptomyces spiralis]